MSKRKFWELFFVKKYVFWTFSENVSAGLTNLHSASAQEYLWEKKPFSKLVNLCIFVQNRGKRWVFEKKIPAGLSKLRFKSPEEHFILKKSKLNIFAQN